MNKLINILEVLNPFKRKEATMTKQDRVLNALKEGAELTSAEIKKRFKAGNPAAVIQALRFAGYSIYLNSKKDARGKKSHVYRLGTPSRKVIAAGYKALSLGMADA
jgi:predicted transcriptional regulator